MNLTERAILLKHNAGRALAAPSAFLLPPHVRQLIEDQAALLADLARAIESKEESTNGK